jgi:Ig-like domain-containing protein
LIRAISSPVVANTGDTVTFSVSASEDPLTYQWKRNGADLSDATNATLTLVNVQAADAGSYTMLVRNPYGYALSPSTSLSFPPPMINSQPQSVTRYRGESASFTVSASGVAPLSYQWLKASASVPGATAAVLMFTNVRSTNAGSYRVIVTDTLGSSTTSTVATLTVIDPTLSSSVTLRPVADTSIFSSGANPQGVATILAGTRRNGIIDRGLLRFDLSSIPTGVAIHSAMLRLTVVRVPSFPAHSNFSLYRMLRPWGTDATWANATAGAPWSTLGGQAGVDYSTISTATRFVSGGGVYDFGPGSQMASEIQAWLENPGANRGWMLKSESESSLGSARHFGSSESAQPPQLVLQYGASLHRARVADPVVQGGNFIFRFDSADGWFYRVECRENLESGTWTTITNVPAGPPNTIVISVPFTPPRRFYRVIAE